MKDINSTLSNPTLIILRHFPRLKAAEHELVIRIAASAEELGWNAHILNINSSTKIHEILRAEIDANLVLDIHYEYPKFMIPKSIGAFWTPTSFMKDWDLPYVWENQLSHDHLVYPDSPEIFNLLKLFRNDDSFQILNHSLPGSWLYSIKKQERNTELKAFYSGINWDKFSGKPGRYNKLFEILDSSDLVAIYGPSKIQHIRPWAGFSNYHGEIPFDGKSILSTARAHGVSLVLSTEEHKNEGIMSNRLFEGLAAGNVIISDNHPFVRRHLGSNAFYLNLEKGDLHVAKQIQEIMMELRENSHKTQELQKLSHEIFLSKFDLTKQLKNLLQIQKKQTIISDISVIIKGDKTTKIDQSLENVGIKNIHYTNMKLRDLADLIELGRSLNFRKFLVLNTETEFLDSFEERLNRILMDMEIQKSAIGMLSTVCLQTTSSNFSPAILTSLSAMPLNGIVLNIDLLSFNGNTIVDLVPSLRIKQLRNIEFISEFRSTFQFLQTIGESLRSPTKPGNFLTNSTRNLVVNSLKEKHLKIANDLAEEIRVLPRSRKKNIVYILLASLTIFRPFVIFYKQILAYKGRFK